jgi:pimeloyl-ACP methyl ester carboxylesterase
LGTDLEGGKMDTIISHIHHSFFGQGDQIYLLMHNAGADHTFLMAQGHFLSQYGRVLMVDLPGHGKSDKSIKEYTIEDLAQNLAELLKYYELKNVVVVGLNFGGDVGIELTASHPELVSHLILIDLPIFMSSSLIRALHDYIQILKENKEVDEMIEALLNHSFIIPTEKLKATARPALKTAPAYVKASVYESLLKWDHQSQNKLNQCKIPILYIDTQESLCGQIDKLQNMKNIMIGKVIGSKYWPTLEVPDQVNGMIYRFLEVLKLI